MDSSQLLAHETTNELLESLREDGVICMKWIHCWSGLEHKNYLESEGHKYKYKMAATGYPSE